MTCRLACVEDESVPDRKKRSVSKKFYKIYVILYKNVS